MTSDWNKKGGTLSDKSAREEYRLSEEEIMEAFNSGKLNFRVNHVYGNPYYRLIRREVEILVIEIYGAQYLQKIKIEKELKDIKSELRKHTLQINALEKRKAELLADLDEFS